MEELDEHESLLFEEFDHPISSNYFDSLLYNNATYLDMWTIGSAILFATTTVIPVGFGLITPRSFSGRLILVLYALVGIPLALVTISDVGRFICDFIFRVFKRKTKTAIWLLTSLAVLYPLFGSLMVWHYSGLSLVDSYYYCLITSLTIGFGDIKPPIGISALIGFIVCGVILMTIAIEVVGTNAIHQIHYMGRQFGKAHKLAGRFIQMAHLNINTGLGVGMAQLSNLARFSLFFIPGAGTNRGAIGEIGETEWLGNSRSTFAPRIPGIEFVDLAEDFEEF
ncbi:hypothetical protein M3Y97_00725700 [Aphelenchoides bicaudatus]|nr:hypothetical protein M3Y97_00725700 [Aphelenchoides bicaudatus]